MKNVYSIQESAIEKKFLIFLNNQERIKDCLTLKEAIEYCKENKITYKYLHQKIKKKRN